MGELVCGVARLAEAEREALAAYAARASWPAGFASISGRRAADGVFVVTRGRVVLRSRVRAGRGFVPWIAAPGETFGSEGPRRQTRATRQTRGPTRKAKRSFSARCAFARSSASSRSIRSTLINQLMAERAALLDKLRELTTLSVEQRLIATLVRMASNNTFTREDGRIVLCSARYRLLCELVGATRESVSLVLGRLVSEGAGRAEAARR